MFDKMEINTKMRYVSHHTVCYFFLILEDEIKIKIDLISYQICREFF